MMSLSVIVFWFLVYSYIRQQGLLAFLPPALQQTMLETSFFDILVNIFIHRRISKMLIAIFSPFLNSQTADEVKEKLKQEGKLPTTVYKALFRKGIMNNMSTGMKSIMVPIKEPILAK